MTGLIVITRPRDEAEGLATELTARGYDTLVEPMLRIVQLPAAIPDLGAYRALIFTSANGVRSFAERSDDRSLPAYAVGMRTADSLRKAGFTDVRGASGDAGLLAAFIGETLGNTGPVLHVAAKEVARDLEPLLTPAGIAVDALALYEAVPAQELSKALVDALYACTIDSVLFFSVRTAATFGTLLNKHGLAEMITSLSALCLSDQVAAEAGKLPWRKVMAASEHSTQSLIALLPRADAIGRDAGNGRIAGRGPLRPSHRPNPAPHSTLPRALPAWHQSRPFRAHPPGLEETRHHPPGPPCRHTGRRGAREHRHRSCRARSDRPHAGPGAQAGAPPGRRAGSRAAATVRCPAARHE